MTAFVAQIRGERDRVGLIEFGNGIKYFVPPLVLNEENRQALLNQIESMEAYGGTALLDAVYDSSADLIALQDNDAINAIVVMTDGQENESTRSLGDIHTLLQNHELSAPPVIFTIAFGDSADERMLSIIAEIGSGQFRRANETDIEELYQVISTYF